MASGLACPPEPAATFSNVAVSPAANALRCRISSCFHNPGGLSRKDFLIAKSQGKTYKFFHFSATVYLTSPQPSPTAKTRAKGEKLGKGERSSGEVFPRFAIVTSSRLHKLPA